MKLFVKFLWGACLLCAANSVYLLFIGDYGLATFNLFLSCINGLNATVLKEDNE